MENTFNYIITTIEKAYNISPIVFVERFDLTFSKFTTRDHHFLIKTMAANYFLKRYDISYRKKIVCEINAVNKFKEKICIPKIFQTKEKKDCFITDNDIFVLYEYIDALNLKDSKEEMKSFFDILCDVECKLVESKLNNKKFYNFQPRISKFELEAVKLLGVLKNDERSHSKRDIKYIKFLIKEVGEIKLKILSLKIEKNFIHGDFLMQNVIRDSSKTLWVLDWEKSVEYITSVDVLKSIMFTIFDPSKEDMNFNVDVLIKWSKYCFRKINLSREEISNAFDLYYFNFITSVDFLKKLYIEKQDLNEKMLGEDFLICKWIKYNKKYIQKSINDELF